MLSFFKILFFFENFSRQLENPIGAGPRIKLHKNLLLTFAIYHTTVLITLYSRVSQHRVTDDIAASTASERDEIRQLVTGKPAGTQVDMEGLIQWHDYLKHNNHTFYKPHWMDMSIDSEKDVLNKYLVTAGGDWMNSSLNGGIDNITVASLEDWIKISRHYEMTMLDSKVCTWAVDHLGSISLCMLVMPMYWYSWLANYAWMLNEGLYSAFKSQKF